MNLIQVQHRNVDGKFEVFIDGLACRIADEVLLYPSDLLLPVLPRDCVVLGMPPSEALCRFVSIEVLEQFPKAPGSIQTVAGSVASFGSPGILFDVTHLAASGAWRDASETHTWMVLPRESVVPIAELVSATPGTWHSASDLCCCADWILTCNDFSIEYYSKKSVEIPTFLLDAVRERTAQYVAFQESYRDSILALEDDFVVVKKMVMEFNIGQRTFP